MITHADLRARAEQLRQSAKLLETKAGLRDLSADINNCSGCRVRASEDRELRGACLVAADMVLAALKIFDEVRVMLGEHPQPDRPSLKVIDGGDDPA